LLETTGGSDDSVMADGSKRWAILSHGLVGTHEFIGALCGTTTNLAGKDLNGFSARRHHA
jgi:hypothetical protein